MGQVETQQLEVSLREGTGRIYFHPVSLLFFLFFKVILPFFFFFFFFAFFSSACSLGLAVHLFFLSGLML